MHLVCRITGSKTRSKSVNRIARSPGVIPVRAPLALPTWCTHSDHHTEVIETFDGSTARFPPALKIIKAYDRNQKAVLKDAGANLKALVESETIPVNDVGNLNF